MQLLLPFPSLQVRILPPFASSSIAISSLQLPNERIACVNVFPGLQTDAPFHARVSSFRNLTVKAGESVSTFLEEGDENAAASNEDSDGVSPELDTIIKDAIDNFVQCDIEDASEKYGLEEELFAEIDFAQINAFTEWPFSGNPAAVCYLPLRRSDEWLQLVAREFNLSDTAFLMKRNTKKNRSTVFKKNPEEELAEEKDASVDEFDLRWFTPKVEVDLCGHASLASAHLLFSSGIALGDTIIFHTRSGILKARKVTGYDKATTVEKDGSFEESSRDNSSKDARPGFSEELNTDKKRPIGVGVVELDFPLDAFTKCNDIEAENLSTILGVKLLWAGKTSLGNYLAEVSCSKEIKQLQPDFVHMMDLPGLGIIVTSPADKDSGLDFVSRYFAPKAGIVEDPVTGSAHCSLGPFWADRLGKSSLKAYQASDRGGYIDVRVDKNEGRVYLQGSAVLVMAGVLLNTLRA